MLNELVKQNKAMIQSLINEVHTVIPGEIVSFDPDKCLAVVLPIGKFRKPDGKMLDFPEISGVPIVFIQGTSQTATMVYPVKKGDGCLVIIAEQALDTWLYGGESDSDLRFDLTNAIAIIGLFVNPNPIVKEACDQDAIIIDKDGKRITVNKDGIAIRGNVTIEGNVSITGDLEMTGDASISGDTVISGTVNSGEEISSAAGITAAENINAGGSISTSGGSMDADGTMRVPRAVIEEEAVIEGILIVDDIEMNTHVHISGDPGAETGPPIKDDEEEEDEDDETLPDEEEERS